MLHNSPPVFSNILYKYHKSNNPDVPNGWAVPDDLAKKISEVLNNKPISPEDELADALEEMARDIALSEPNLMDWIGWVTYLQGQTGFTQNSDLR